MGLTRTPHFAVTHTQNLLNVVTHSSVSVCQFWSRLARVSRSYAQNIAFSDPKVSSSTFIDRNKKRLVLNVPPRTPSLPLLQQLHWLPIEARISYRLCSLMYRVTHITAPLYLVELCQPCSDTRLRSASCSDYNVPRTNRRFTNSSFSISAPTVWNCLPSHIRSSPTFSSFLTRFKTHLFNTSFSPLSQSINQSIFRVA